MQEIEIYLKKFKNVVLLLLFVIFVFGFFVSKLVPIVTEYVKTATEHSTSIKTLEEKKRTLEDMKKNMAESEKKAQNDKKTLLKSFYKPIEKGLDAETVIANEFSEILELLRVNSIKMKSIKYDYNPADDNFVRNVSSEYQVARLNAEMIATYKNFEGFLKELYKHEHFLDISNIEIVPYQKDKKILIIKFQLKLYAQK